MNLDDQILSNLFHFQAGPLINVGSGTDNTIKELSGIVAQVVEYEDVIQWDTTKPDGTPRKILDSSRLASLGWSPSYSLEKGIRQTYEWYIKGLKQSGVV